MRLDQHTGMSFRRLYEDVERQTGVRPAQLDGPSLPEAAYRIWGYFQDLAAKRRWRMNSGGAIPDSISYQEMGAYFSLLGIQAPAWQIRLLSELDDVFRAAMMDSDQIAEAGTASGLGQVLRSGN